MKTEIRFSSTAKTIMRYTTRKYTQGRLKGLICGKACATEYDQSNFNSWLNGKKNASTDVYDYYEKEESVGLLAEDIRTDLIPAISDLSRLMEELDRAIHRDETISAAMRAQLHSGGDEAERISKILRFAILRRDQNENGTPELEWQFQKNGMPKADKIFVGRREELDTVGKRLSENHLLFLVGEPGIGKRSLAMQYAQRQKKRYHNRFFLRFHGSIKETVAGMQHIDDHREESQEERFERHSRLLRSLGSDCLLVMIGLDRLPEEDEAVSFLEELDCHIIVTTCLEMKNHPRMVIRAIATLEGAEELFYAYCPRRRAGYEGDVRKLIEGVGRNTYAVKLLALTIREGFFTPAEMLQTILDPSEMLLEEEDEGCYQYLPMEAILERLFQYTDLSEQQLETLRLCTMIPLTGVQKARFARWIGHRREIQHLIRTGWIQEEGDGVLSMNMLARAVIGAHLKSTVENSKSLLDGLDRECKRGSAKDSMELAYCIAGVFEQLSGLDGAAVPYLISYTQFLHRIHSGVIIDFQEALPEELRNGTRGEAVAITLDCISHLVERTSTQVGQMQPTEDCGIKELLDRIEQLVPQCDEKDAAWLRVSCALLLGTGTISSDHGVLFDLLELMKTLESGYPLHTRDDQADYFGLLSGLMVVADEKDRTEQFLELCQWKLEDAGQNWDSEIYQEKLERLAELGREMEQKTSEESWKIIEAQLWKEPFFAALLIRAKGMKGPKKQFV